MRLRALVLGAIVFAVSLAAHGASNRVFVSPAGVDTGPCSPISSPCRNFSYAIGQVSPGGEIIALATAGYGPVTINQSVAIVAAPGVTAFIAAASGSAVNVNAGPTDVVTLRGLAMNSTGASFGIVFGGGLSLNIEHCIVNGFTYGIYFSRQMDATKPHLQVLGSVVRNGNIGIWTYNYGPGSPAGGPAPVGAYLTVAGSVFLNNFGEALLADDNTQAVMTDSVMAGSFIGVYCHAVDSYSLPVVSLQRCSLSRNIIGIQTGGQGPGNPGPVGLVRISDCMISGNETGVQTDSGGQLLSRVSASIVTNTISGNGIDVAGPIGTYAAK